MIRFFFALIAACLIADSSNAAIISTNSFATFQTNGLGALGTSNFDGFADGTALGTLGDVMFTETTGATLLMSDGGGDVLSNGATFGVTSTPNFVNMENPAGAFPNSVPLTENESITISFGAPRQAVGLFVYFDRFNVLNTGSIALTTSGVSATAGIGTGIREDLPVNDTAYFLGLYDNAGVNSISSVTLDTNGGTMRYVFDHVVTYQAVSVPEPSSLLAVGGLAICFVIRRRRESVAN